MRWKVWDLEANPRKLDSKWLRVIWKVCIWTNLRKINKLNKKTEKWVMMKVVTVGDAYFDWSGGHLTWVTCYTCGHLTWVTDLVVISPGLLIWWSSHLGYWSGGHHTGITDLVVISPGLFIKQVFCYCFESSILPGGKFLVTNCYIKKQLALLMA